METVQLYESGRELCPRTNYENDGAPQKIQQMEAFLDELAARVAAALAEAKAYADGTYMQASGYTDLKVADLINGAPTTLDTLKEIADAMLENESVVQALEAAVGAKANEVEFQAHAGNGTTHVTAGEREKWNGAKTSIDSVCQQLDEMGAKIAQINSNLSIKINTYSFEPINVTKDKFVTIEKKIDIPDGYKPVGIVGWSISHPSWGSVKAIRLINNSRNTVRIYFYTDYADYSEIFTIEVMMLPTIWFT